MAKGMHEKCRYYMRARQLTRTLLMLLVLFSVLQLRLWLMRTRNHVLFDHHHWHGRQDCPRTRFEMLAWLGEELNAEGIEWFVHFGTLLGAVRNRSMIPWSDDVDICIPEDSEDLAKAFFQDQSCIDARNYPSAVSSLYPKSVGAERMSRHWLLGFLGFSHPVWVDVYTIFNCSQYGGSDNCTEHRLANGDDTPGVYLAGSCHEAKNRHIAWHDIFPINKTGVTIDGMVFPSPNRPEMVLAHEYGPTWCELQESHVGGMASGCRKASLTELPGPCVGFIAS